MKQVRKYLSRMLIGALIYVFFHINNVPDLREAFPLNLVDRVLLVYMILVVMVLWEVLDIAIIRLKIATKPLARLRNLVSAILRLSLVALPFVVLASWFAELQIKPFLSCPVHPDGLVRDIIQGQVFTWLIIATKLFRIYSDQEKKMSRDLALVQKELLQTKYQNLKNQVNPHFLFNSFSVLQNLIETDPSKASIFLEKLSAMYRYLLELRDEAMSSIERELEVMGVYLYLLKTRHEDRLIVNISIDPRYHQRFVPTLSLQMLIENAVKHNSFSSDEPLVIDLYVEDDYLVVKNQLRKKGSAAQSTRIGLENIRNQYSLQTERDVIVSKEEGFFTVKLPVLSGIRLT